MKHFLVNFRLCAAIISGALLQTSYAASDLSIQLSPVYGRDQKISYVNLLITNQSEYKGPYVVGFSVNDGHGICDIHSENLANYPFRENEPGSAIQRLFKFELSQNSVISFYVDLINNGAIVDGSCVVDVSLRKDSDHIGNNVIDRKQLYIDKRLPVGEESFSTMAINNDFAYVYGYYYSKGTELIFPFELHTDKQERVVDVRADLLDCPRARKNKYINPNHLMYMRGTSFGNEHTKTYVFYGSMDGKPEAYSGCKARFRVTNDQAEVIQEVIVPIKTSGKYVSDYDELHHERIIF
jgi:hypothetical protein